MHIVTNEGARNIRFYGRNNFHIPSTTCSKRARVASTDRQLRQDHQINSVPAWRSKKRAHEGFGLRALFEIESDLYTDQRDALHPDVMRLEQAMAWK